MPQTLLDWVKRVEVDSGVREGVTSGEAQRVKGLERKKLRSVSTEPAAAQIGESIDAAPRAFNNAVIGRGMGAELGDRLGYAAGATSRDYPPSSATT
ncbi:MAG: hypothetical protein NVSMB6_09550 [Burkholderiaceae bacterium]